MSERTATQAPPAPSRLRLFLRANLGDFALVLVASVCLVLTVSFAFESAPLLRGNAFIITVAVIPLLVILYAGGWSKRAVAFAAVGAVLYCALILGLCVAAQPYAVELFTDGRINDTPQSYVVFGLVLVVTPILVYLLSRRRFGAVLLVVSAIVACGAIHLLYPEWAAVNGGTPVTVVALIACGALLIFQGYKANAYRVRHLESTAFGSAFLYSTGISAVCFGLGAVVFFAIISPLGLRTVELKPFEDYYYRPVVEYTGVYDVSYVEDPENVTGTTNDQVSYTHEEAEGGAESQSPDSTGASGSNPVASALEQMAAFDLNSWLQEFMAISYERLKAGAAFIVTAIVLALVFAALLQRYLRKRRVAKLEAMPLEHRIWSLYRYFCKSFAKMGYGKADAMTPLEYAFASATTLSQFSRGTDGVDFVDVTLAYQRACLDEGRATEEDWETCKAFYEPFFRNARLHVGNLRWLKYFWRL